MAVSRRRSIQVDSADILVHPIADRSEGIVVERIHPGILERAVRANPVPPLPHRRRPARDRVEPGRIGALREQCERSSDMSGGAEYVQQVWGSEKTGGQMVVARFHVARQSPGG